MAELALYDAEGKEIPKGTELEDFKEHKYRYICISKGPGLGSSGKILVEDGRYSREFFPSVFRCTIREKV